MVLANGGLYEVFIGVSKLDVAIRYWESFGYEVEKITRIDPVLGENLYGHMSGGRVARLSAATEDGLIRLIEWDIPANAGLGMCGLRFAGNRWTGQFARSLLTVLNHAAAAKAAGTPLDLGDIHFIDMGKAYAHLFGGSAPEPFETAQIALREAHIFQPESRQVILERFGYDSPLLGSFADDSLMRTTQIVQGCMVVQSDDPDIFGFYQSVLGLKRSLDIEIPYEQAQASRHVFGLAEGETHWNVDLDQPTSEATLEGRRSGRLKCFRFATRYATPSVHHLASPGSLGMSNYSWRVRDIAEARALAVHHGASDVTPVIEDEFGAPAFSLRAPDGYFWTFIEDAGSA